MTREPHDDDTVSPMTGSPLASQSLPTELESTVASENGFSNTQSHANSVPISQPPQRKPSTEGRPVGGNELLATPDRFGQSTETTNRMHSAGLAESRGKESKDIPDEVFHDGDSPSAAGRRSVQFARFEPPEFQPSHSRHGSLDSPDIPGKSRGASFMSKLKSFTTNNSPTSTGLQSPRSTFTDATHRDSNLQTSLASIPSSQYAPRVPGTLHEEHSDADADVDETADELNTPGAGVVSKKKRRMRRFIKGEMHLPTSPRFANDPEPLSPYNRFLRRRASMPDTTAHDQALSDGETKEQLWRRPFARRGHSYMNATATPPGDHADDIDVAENSAVVGRRHGHVRRITVFGGGGVSDGDAIAPRRPFFNSERASVYGAQKWKQVKSTLKLLRQKKEDRVDYFKSAELMAELRAGAPAVLMLASMIQRDEHGNKRIPVLLEQLKLNIKDSAPMPDDDKERHWLFTIELEYGSGPSRMGWTVTRTIRDIYNLHFRYKFALNNDKYMIGRLDLGAKPKQPKFPYSAFPYLRSARNKEESSDEEDQASIRGGDAAAEATANEDGLEDAGASGIDGSHQHRRKRSRVNMLGLRRRSTGFTDMGDTEHADGPVTAETKRQRYIEKQRKVLEKYLSEMIHWLMFRADSNRLCRFLELSALGVRLAAEGSYHGKEGYLHIQSSKGLDFRRVLTPAKVIARHSRKWFLVRQSYIVCVESPENMNIYDVYLVDSKFSIVSKRNALKQIASKSKQSEVDLTVESPPEKHHTLILNTSERKVRLFSRYQSVMKQFEESMNEMLRQTVWFEKKRFDSYAPVRTGVFAQWLVDGRDYMWNVSRAINMARDVIYIHDWWLSPELYMRRPAAISQKWRLDRLLQKKAREGVKVFVIIYRNVEAAIPIDSEYTKFSLLNLHPNIFVQRSPNQFKKNQFFFAHHEKICVVDHDVAFLGGIDLCFGRWDCPQHPIVDDKPTGFEMSEQPKDAEHCQLFPGKDYSNPRVQDFFRLTEPYEEMYERSKVPRMPWHDVSMQVVGQPARDLTRHFVQRWNYLRRGRKSTRPLPFLLPPPDAKSEDLEALGLTGTCEVQMLRSATTWSLGLEETEHSIQTAYVKMIEDSDHFVYIENQFFISSTEVYNTKIVNRIGDALVSRIIRAHEKGEDWRCVIVIPLMPGFQNTVDEQEGTSVRLILMCQYRSICRGEQSIFGRLRAAGIDPENYIDFYSLRQWGVMSTDVLVTEQLYIHAKTIIVDDRVALIGSANINERSMLGNRDSECAAIVRDTDMIWSTMAGKPYRVGRFAHTLRLRLMREHLGLDVDEILEQERHDQMEREAFEQRLDEIYNDDPLATSTPGPSSRPHDATGGAPDAHRTGSLDHDPNNNETKLTEEEEEPVLSYASSPSNSVSRGKGKSNENKSRFAREKLDRDVSGYGIDQWKSAEATGMSEGRDSVVVSGREVLLHDIDPDGKGTVERPNKGVRRRPTADRNRYLAPGNAYSESLPPVPPFDRRSTEQLGLPRSAQLPSLPVLDDTDIGGPPVHFDSETGRPLSGAFHPLAADIKLAEINKDCMRDPIESKFFDEVWNRVARNNTKLYRRVFRCMPDSEVSTWADYREYVDYGKRFQESMEGRQTVSEETDAKCEVSSQPASAAAAIGVGVPGPGALAHAAKSEAEKAVGDLAKDVTHGTLDETNGSDGKRDNKADEKQQLEAERQGYFPQQNVNPTANERSQKEGEDETSPTSRNEARTATNEKFLTESFPNRDRKTTFSTLDKPPSRDHNDGATVTTGDTIKRRRRATTKGSRRWSTAEDMPSRADAEELLKMVQGNLVQFPYDWLLTEEHNGNWGYQVDGVAPLAIYN